MTFFNTLPLQSLPRNICASKSLLYPSLHLQCKLHTPLYINNNILLVLIIWNYFHLLNASDTLLTRLGLWINFTFISAKVLCHSNRWRSLVLVFQNTTRTYWSCTPWSCATSNNVATSSNRALRQIVFFHELAICSDNQSIFCSHKRWAVHLASTFCQLQNCSNLYVF